MEFDLGIFVLGILPSPHVLGNKIYQLNSDLCKCVKPEISFQGKLRLYIFIYDIWSLNLNRNDQNFEKYETSEWETFSPRGERFEILSKRVRIHSDA